MFDALDQKAFDLCALAIEAAADDDESIDKRDPEKLSHQRGSEVTGVAWLSGYDSRGDAPPCLQKVIDSHYDAQNREWQRQYPDRPDLHTCYDSDNPALSSEAEEWLDAKPLRVLRIRFGSGAIHLQDLQAKAQRIRR